MFPVPVRVGIEQDNFCLLACAQHFFPAGEGAQASMLSVSTQLPYSHFCFGDS